MKRLFCILFACSVAALSWGQTAQEIIARMDEAMAKVDSDNVAFSLDMKMPIIGTVNTRAYSCGEKSRMEISKGDEKSIVWIDGDTQWELDVKKNEIEISRHEPTASSTTDDNMEMFDGITDGYDVSIKKETPTQWQIRCKKSSSNKDKDDPKTMDLVVSKADYMPLSLSAKMSMVTVTIRDVSFNVTESMVTFDPTRYPTAKIIDKR